MAQGLFRQTCPCCGKQYTARTKEELQKIMHTCPCAGKKSKMTYEKPEFFIGNQQQNGNSQQNGSQQKPNKQRN